MEEVLKMRCEAYEEDTRRSLGDEKEITMRLEGEGDMRWI